MLSATAGKILRIWRVSQKAIVYTGMVIPKNTALNTASAGQEPGPAEKYMATNIAHTISILAIMRIRPA